MKLFSAGFILVLAAASAALWSMSSGTVHSGTAGMASLQQDLPDTTGAAVWTHLEAANYTESWDLWPGTEPMYEGNDPHGMLLTTHVNPVALAAINQGAEAMPQGAIVVKRNYMPDGTLDAVTTMYKRAGYNPDHNDWFFVKHLADGSLDQADMNGTMMPMEGRVPGCQNCHGQVADNDYLFTGPLGAD